MPVRVFLLGRQVPVLALLLVATGVLVWFGGDWNMPLPGARVPIVLGSLAPLITTCVCLNGLDAGGSAWAEEVAPRRLGGPRAALLSALLGFAAAVVLVAGTHSLGLPVAASLVRGTGLLVGPAAVAWLLGGQGAGVAVASVLTVVFSSFGGRGAAEGEVWASWAVLFAEPGDVCAWELGVGGFAVAAVAAWLNDDLRDLLLTRAPRGGRTREAATERDPQHPHRHDTAS